jgi:SAM-dependent methyltransferase
MKQDYTDHWNEKFLSGEWGRYPPEELVRFVGRNYKKSDRGKIHFLEVGCGPGANLWFLHREGYNVSGIDGSPAAIEQARLRIREENQNIGYEPDLRVGNFAQLPWDPAAFDVVIDVFAVYANMSAVIDQTLSEVYRVLKPGGRFFSKMWGTQTTGFGQGTKLQENTYTDVPGGPCRNMGVSHFFDEAEIRKRMSRFQIEAIDRVLRSDSRSGSQIEELIFEGRKT